MKIRRDSVFISAVLFTIALLCALPVFLRNALEGYSSMSEVHGDCCGLYLHTMGDLGVASLAIIFIALIVTWAGYAKCLRSAWFAMFVVAWGWAFPLLALPLFKNSSALTFVEVIYGALHGHLYPRLIGFSVAGALVIAIALLAWIDFRTYEIPSVQMTQMFPLPPPPPYRAPAEDWLSLRAERKYGYVRGYLTGFQGGKRLACSFCGAR